MDLFGLFHAINWINSLPCWINMHSGFHIIVQVSILSLFPFVFLYSLLQFWPLSM